MPKKTKLVETKNFLYLLIIKSGKGNILIYFINRKINFVFGINYIEIPSIFSKSFFNSSKVLVFWVLYFLFDLYKNLVILSNI